MLKFQQRLRELITVLLGGCLAIPTPLPTLTYTQKYLNPFIAGNWDFSVQAPIWVSVYGDQFGLGSTGNTIVIGSWIMTVIALIWIRQENAAVPMMLFVILGNVLILTGMIPTEWLMPIVILMVLLPIGAIVYTMISKRSNYG